MKTTGNYHLKKPDYEDGADIQVLNENADIIDAELKKNADHFQGGMDAITKAKGQPNGYAGLDANGKLVPMPTADDVGAMFWAGTLTDAQIDDMTTLKDYRGIATPSNTVMPYAGGYWNVWRWRWDASSNRPYEEAVDVNTNVKYCRFCNGTVWSAWQQSNGNQKSWVATAVTMGDNNHCFNLTIPNFTYSKGCTVTFLAPNIPIDDDWLYINIAGFAALALRTITHERIPVDAWVANSQISVVLDTDVKIDLTSSNSGRGGTAFFKGGAGNSAKLNFFAQPSAPASKDGLWIQTPSTVNIKNIITKMSYIISGTWRQAGSIPSMPSLSSASGNSSPVFCAIPYGNKLFIFVDAGSGNNSNSAYAGCVVYTFDTNTWTNIGTFAYLDGNSNNHSRLRGCIAGAYNGMIYAYVANIHSSYTFFKTAINPNNLTITEVGGSSVDQSAKTYCGQMGSAIFSQCGSGDNSMYLYKKDMATDTASYFKATNASGTVLSYAKGFVFNNCWYYFANTTSSLPYLWRKDLNSGATVQLASPPGAVSWGQTQTIWIDNGLMYIYWGYTTNLLVYSIATNTYYWTASCSENLQPIVTVVNGKLITCTDYPGIYSNNVNCYDLQSETLIENTLAFNEGTAFSTKMINTAQINYLKTFFQNVWWYSGGVFHEYPTYIGDGANWIKIKN